MMSAWGLVASMLVQAVATIMFMVAVGTVVFLFISGLATLMANLTPGYFDLIRGRV